MPPSARIITIADVNDALRSRRPYKEPLDHDESGRIIMEHAGTHFDPDVVDAFLARKEEFTKVSESSTRESWSPLYF